MRLACPYQLSPTQNLIAGGAQLSARNEGVAVDPYWASVVLLAINDNAADGTTMFVDQSTSAKTITTVGNAQYDTAQAPTGMTSTMLSDGTGDRLTLANSGDFDFGSGDFTIEYMIRFATTAEAHSVDKDDFDSVRFWHLSANRLMSQMSFIYWVSGTPVIYRPSYSPVIDTWYHHAISRTGTDLKAFVDGSQIGVSHNIGTSTIDAGSTLLTIAGSQGGGGTLNGWESNVRITKGVGRYTGTFTPPTLPMPTS